MSVSEVNTLVRLSIVESKLEDIQKESDKQMEDLNCEITDIKEKIVTIKCQICKSPCNTGNSANDTKNLQDQLNELEEQVDDIRLELPEIRLTKQIVMGLVAIILTSVVGIVWNAVVDDNNSSQVSVATKKVIEEYNGGKK